eukprot:7157492-Prymnesium_polylepis.1
MVSSRRRNVIYVLRTSECLLITSHRFFYKVRTIRRCRAGGRRPAGEHRAEHLRRPARRRSGAAPPHS